MILKVTNITPELGIDNGKGRAVIRDTWPTALAPGETRVVDLGSDSGQAAPHLTHLRASRYLSVEVLDDDSEEAA